MHLSSHYIIHALMATLESGSLFWICPHAWWSLQIHNNKALSLYLCCLRSRTPEVLANIEPHICIHYVYMYTLWAGLQTAFDDLMPVQQSSSCCCFLIMCCHVLWCTVKQQKQNEAVLIGWIIRNGQCHAWCWPSYDTEDWSNDE